MTLNRKVRVIETIDRSARGRACVVRWLPDGTAPDDVVVTLVAEGLDGSTVLGRAERVDDGLHEVWAYADPPSGAHRVLLIAADRTGAKVAEWSLPHGVLGLRLALDLWPAPEGAEPTFEGITPLGAR